MTEVLRHLFLWALTLTGYPDPGQLPAVAPIPYERLKNEVCDNRHCTAVAYYDSRNDTIYFDDRLNLASDHNARGFVVHEMVHYLQNKAGFLDAADITCDTRINLEREAYRVQRYFLKEHGASTRQVDIAMSLIVNACHRDREATPLTD